ncbi:phospholipid carrier-dependent glycosyltransferase [Nocardioides silvaticus]|uniref:Polyprenol-phosphate-mannose--protein mannosyltransferase n=1 Tax=Nocardioides silvaticus TaxID=2201891 RepID=A0A316TDP2_9ACTN|nr:phospholipid carrier-dependent glycosyltransferase [Nocardioides silvaticus]PWN01365.1 phospholipid carrier-dependent glycosyltransferase [Nocardioides silvaticus]
MTATEDEQTAERWSGLSRTAVGRPVPSAVERARGVLAGLRPTERVTGWLAPLAVTLLAFALRMYHLGTPKRFAFDETYYAKDAWSLLNNGYAQTYLTDVDGNTENKIDDDILAGHVTDVWTGDPSMAVHPEVGKWLIALGEKAFGMDPFGWRIASAVVGALMVLVMCRLLRRMTGSTMLGCIGGLLLMFDGLHFVLSRLALLDIFVAFFILCGIHCAIADRDHFRRRLAARVSTSSTTAFGSTTESGSTTAGEGTYDGWGPVRAVLLRPWLVAGGVCFGLAAGTKWVAVYPLAAFGLLVWFWSAGARRSFGVRWAVARSALVDGVPAFLSLVVVALVTYIATWGGWLANAGEYEEHLSATQYRQYTGHGHCAEDDDSYIATDLDKSKHWPTADEEDASGVGEAWQSLRSLWYYHQDVYTFHTHFLNCSKHTYASKPSSWLLINRPVGVAVTNDIQPADRVLTEDQQDLPRDEDCDAPEGSDCIRQVLLIGTPMIWWGGCIALLFSLVMWIGARDWRYGVAVVGTLSTWLPWMQYDDRPIFYFYAIAILPFIVIALTLSIGTLIGPSRLPSTRRTIGVVVSGAFVVLVLVNYAWFWPIWTNGLLTSSEWLDRIWFSRWV